MTLACNLANAVGVTPKLIAYNMPKAPACLKLPSTTSFPGHPTPIPVNVVLGNVQEAIGLMIAIEHPDTSGDRYPNPQKSYKSIGDFYYSLGCGLNQLWPKTQPKSGGGQKTTFASEYPAMTTTVDWSQGAAHAKENGKQLMSAIVQQGEGTSENNDVVPEEFQPGSKVLDANYDASTHYERFEHVFGLLHPKAKFEMYTADKRPSTKAQQTNDTLNLYYSILLYQLRNSFSVAGAGVNLIGMEEVGSLTTAVWQAGGRPGFKELPDLTVDYVANTGTYGKGAQKKTVPLPPPWTQMLELHICQGLNACAGHGANHSGTMPGDGTCATVTHACQNTNNCRGQGACGTAGVGTFFEWAPGQNRCAGQGGCQSPIRESQVYCPGEVPWCDKVTPVWEVARALFEDRMQAQGKAVGPVGPTTAVRKQTDATHNKSACKPPKKT